MTLDVGELIRLRTSAPFKGLDGVAVDPTTVTVTVRSPLGVVTVYTDAVNDTAGVGLFYKDITPDVAGVWTYQFAGSGNVGIIEQGTFTVVAAIMPTTTAGLVSIADYRTATRDRITSDVNVTAALTEAQTLIEEYLGRPLASAERTEDLRIDYAGRVYPLATPITAIASPAGLTNRTAYILGAWPGETFWMIHEWGPIYNVDIPRLTVTYTGGWTSATLPATIRRRLCWEAYKLLHFEALADVPEAAAAATIGDAAVSFGPGGAGAGSPEGVVSPTTRKALRGWVRWL